MLRSFKRKNNDSRHEKFQFTFVSDEARHSFENLCTINNSNNGRRLVAFATEWAALTEAELSKGRKLSQALLAECCEQAEGYEELSGVAFSWAKGILMIHWKYGKHLMDDGQKLLYENRNLAEFYTTDEEVRDFFARNGK